MTPFKTPELTYYESNSGIKDPKHPEHAMYKKWIGGEYDPEYFDIYVVNDLLKEDNFGVFEW